MTDNAIDRLLVLAFGVGGIDWEDQPRSPQGQSKAAEAPPESVLVALKYDLVACLLVGMERHVRESAELSAEVRSGILATVKTAQARLVLNAAFDL